jgi:hypothetical protein
MIELLGYPSAIEPSHSIDAQPRGRLFGPHDLSPNVATSVAHSDGSEFHA